MIFFYGNCQIRHLINCLSLSKKFREKYNIPKIPIKNIKKNIINDNFIYIQNFSLIEQNLDSEKYLDKKYDLAILQYTHERHKKNSSSFIKNRINCEEIIILPYVVNYGYFTLSREGDLSNQIKINNGKIIEQGSDTIYKMGSQEIIELKKKK